MQRQECPIEWPGEFRLVEQLSRSTCKLGLSWGVEAQRLWVDKGCRGVFESIDNSKVTKAVPGPGEEGYPAGLPRRVTCESRNQQRTDCDMDTRGEVRMLRRLSHADCELGLSWGMFRHSVWVDRGCRAVFESSGTDYDHRPNRLPGWAIRACNSVEYNHGRVIEWSTPRPGTFEITLEDANGRFDCNVEPGGRVTSYSRSASG